ncbi:LytR C-terminal domain-containing protein [Candidatus Wolfebacteria bacterium]|nr:LytR C-terminal domain-containing protein [Candidatus Wolfebacteria bacterium]
MNIDFEKIKVWIKENKIDIFYIAAMLLVIILTISVFFWSMNIILKAVNAVFAIIPQDVSADVLKFDLENFEKISKRMNINFQISRTENQPDVKTGKNEEEKICAQIVVSAVSLDGQCQEFSTPCDVPSDWQKVDKCPQMAIESAVNISKINIRILNGTATTGLAGQWKDKFKAAGFLDNNIKTANADKKDYVGMSVSYNASGEVLTKISEVLQSGNSQIKVSKDSKLSENYFEIIIGK